MDIELACLYCRVVGPHDPTCYLLQVEQLEKAKEALSGHQS